MIDRLLHICNSEPYCFGSKDEFYALKSRLLERYGTPDGYDVQHIPGKPCWSCEGTGGLYEPCGCYKCGGSGWFKHPVWISLKRHRFGRFVFHTPENRSYVKPKPDVTNIEGYVKHACYSRRQVQWAALVLSLLFARQVFWRLASERINSLWICRVTKRRCIDCKRHTWCDKWRCVTCQVLHERGVIDDDEIPF